MRENMENVDIRRVKGGWAALGDGWAVHGETEEEAVKLYYEAIERHKEIDARRIEVKGETGTLARPD